MGIFLHKTFPTFPRPRKSFPFLFPNPWKSVFLSHTHGNPMGFPLWDSHSNGESHSHADLYPAVVPCSHAQRYVPEAEVVSVAAVLSPTMLTTWSNVDVIPPSRPRLASLIEPNSFDEPSVIRDLSAFVASSTDWLTIFVSILRNCVWPSRRCLLRTEFTASSRRNGDIILPRLLLLGWTVVRRI